MSLLVRRGVLTVAAIVLCSLVAAALVEAGVAIGTAGRGAAPLALSPAAATTADASSGAASAGTPAVATSDGTGDLTADVDALLAADQTALPAATAATPVKPAAIGLRRLAVLRRLVHGTVVVDLPKLGGLTTIQLDHGTVSAVSGTSLTIHETGGTDVTVALGQETRVRKHATRATVGDLAAGDEVFVMSRVASTGTDAYLVVVPAR